MLLWILSLIFVGEKINLSCLLWECGHIIRVLIAFFCSERWTIGNHHYIKTKEGKKYDIETYARSGSSWKWSEVASISPTNNSQKGLLRSTFIFRSDSRMTSKASHDEFAGSSSCVTVSGPDIGSPCIFPFTAGGATFYECAEFFNMDDKDYYSYYNYNVEDRKWCSTQVTISISIMISVFSCG